MARLNGGKILLDLSQFAIETITTDGETIDFDTINSDAFYNISKEIVVKLRYMYGIFVIPLTKLVDFDGTYYSYEINVVNQTYLINLGLDDSKLYVTILKSE